MCGPADEPTLQQQLGREIENLYALIASEAAVERLRMRLEEEHAAGRPQGTVDALGFEFVKHPRRYTYFSNSNHMVADWLAELGCTVRGPAFSSRWKVRSPNERSPDERMMNDSQAGEISGINILPSSILPPSVK
jgi:hypothetical protein